MQNSEKRLLSSARIAMWPVIFIWLVHLLKLAGHFQWNRFGIFPRAVDGIAGIFLSPFIHGDFQHLLSNSVPLFFMLTLILFFYRRVSWISILLIYLITGLLVWLFAREGRYHIGASGVIYGMVSFVFWNGVFRKSLKAVVLSLVIIVMYSGYFAGVVPGQEGISWESHLMGALTGIFVSFIFRNKLEDDEHEVDPWEGEDYSPTEYFLDRDTFDKTREERWNQQQRDPFS